MLEGQLTVLVEGDAPLALQLTVATVPAVTVVAPLKVQAAAWGSGKPADWTSTVNASACSQTCHRWAKAGNVGPQPLSTVTEVLGNHNVKRPALGVNNQLGQPREHEQRLHTKML